MVSMTCWLTYNPTRDTAVAILEAIHGRPAAHDGGRFRVTGRHSGFLAAIIIHQAAAKSHKSARIPHIREPA
jgi:hypothetical protein